MVEAETRRLQGELQRALRLVNEGLSNPSLSPRAELALRLEKARILDRLALHDNTRPSLASLSEIEASVALADELGGGARGSVALAFADHYYRAELPEKRFFRAEAYSQTAIELLRAAGRQPALAEAVHRLGLVHLQRRELELARQRFDESLWLDAQANGGRARDWMRGEYHRHVAFVFVFKDDWAGALPHFEASLRHRRRANATDGAMFAAVSLANALVKTGAPRQALELVQYALNIAETLPSPVGAARAYTVLGRAQEAIGDSRAAVEAYGLAVRQAQAVAYESAVAEAQAAIARLAGATQAPPGDQ